MTKRKLKPVLYVAGAVTLALSVTTASFAQFQRNQTRQNQQSANPLGDLIGMIANASAKSKAKKRWAQVTPEVHQCVNTMFASQNVKVEQFIAAGMSPTDANMAPIIELCQTVMTAQLKTNFACNVANAKGQQVATTCVQSYAKAVNGKLAAISRDDFLRAAANDEKVTIADFETVAAQNARLAEERRLAQEAAVKEEAARRERLAREEEERRRFAASPEGKRQAAERAARERRAAAAEAAAIKRRSLAKSACDAELTRRARRTPNRYTGAGANFPRFTFEFQREETHPNYKAKYGNNHIMRYITYSLNESGGATDWDMRICVVSPSTMTVIGIEFTDIAA